jgi:hypothetical protein
MKNGRMLAPNNGEKFDVLDVDVMTESMKHVAICGPVVLPQDYFNLQMTHIR